jgi:hypothetical protein
MALYHVALVGIVIGASQRFLHIVFQSVCGHIFLIRISGASGRGCNRVRSTPYILLFSAGEQQQTYALDREVTEIGLKLITIFKYSRRLPYPVRDAASFYHHIPFVKNPLKHL